jgi:hypothetical protein
MYFSGIGGGGGGAGGPDGIFVAIDPGFEFRFPGV